MNAPNGFFNVSRTVKRFAVNEILRNKSFLNEGERKLTNMQIGKNPRLFRT